MPELNISDNWQNLEFLLPAMIGSGWLGAYCREIFDKSTDSVSRFQTFVQGVAAALLVPLFLSIIRSEVLTRVLKNDPAVVENTLIICGFCLLAAASARSFFDTLSRSVLNKLDQVANEAQAGKATALEARDLAAEALHAAAPVNRGLAFAISPSVDGLLAQAKTENERAIIRSLAKRPGAARSATSLANEGGSLTRATAIEALTALSTRSIVVTTSTSAGTALYQLAE